MGVRRLEPTATITQTRAQTRSTQDSRSPGSPELSWIYCTPDLMGSTTAVLKDLLQEDQLATSTVGSEI